MGFTEHGSTESRVLFGTLGLKLETEHLGTKFSMSTGVNLIEARALGREVVEHLDATVPCGASISCAVLGLLTTNVGLLTTRPFPLVGGAFK